MRFVHTADLHLGRRLAQMPLEHDMDVVLSQLIEVVQEHQADALVIAGDVFDSANPSESSVRQWDAFLSRLAKENITALVVSGNHDSGARLGMGSSLIAYSGIHVAGELLHEVQQVAVDGVTFWLVPFVRPAEVRAWARAMGLADEQVEGVKDYTSALALVCDEIRRRPEFRQGPNVCVAHQFVTAGGTRPHTSQSEQVSLGSLDNVDVSVFDGFDYVALGHVHRPQRIGRDSIRYAGSPLKLSASEIPYQKSFCVVEVEARDSQAHDARAQGQASRPDAPDSDSVSGAGGQARVSCELIPVRPLHDFRRESGSMAELLQRARAESEERRQDYIQAVITDDDPMDVTARLRSVWPNLEEVTFDNALTRAAGADQALSSQPIERGLADLFSDFFEQQAGRPLADDERALAASAFEDARQPTSGEE